MPLSENEQKMLEQMERALYAEDPRFATQMRGSEGAGPSRKRLVLGALAAAAGLALVVAGVATRMTWLGVVGFVVMVAGVAWAFTAGGATSGESTKASAPAAAKAAKRPRAGKQGGASTPGFSQKMEDRWEKRRRESGM